MIGSSKFILIVHPLGLQGLIWQSMLRSQHISVIWESPDVNLIDSINRIKQAGCALPDLLLIDTRLHTVRPYHVCRWCHQNCPEVKVVLVNGAQWEILPAEQQWAINQGAADLLPRFQHDKLVSDAMVRVKQILNLLEIPTFDSGKLISVLLKMKRKTLYE